MTAWKVWSCAALCGLFAIGCSESAEEPGPGRADPTSPYQRVDGDEASLALRMRGAEQVVVASVEHVDPHFALNEFGDKLIMSTVTLRVHDVLRGSASSTVRFELEGGTIGDLALDVSDMPKLARGDRGLFALRRSRSGDGWLPNRRSLGILTMAVDGDLEALRRAERASR